MSRPEYLNYRITEQRRTRLDALASLTHSTSDADTIDAALTIALKETNMNADRAKEVWEQNVGGTGTSPTDFIRNGKLDNYAVSEQLSLVKEWCQDADMDADTIANIIDEVRESIVTLVEIELERMRAEHQPNE